MPAAPKPRPKRSTEKAIHVSSWPLAGVNPRREVRILARAEGYAMVRCKGDTPYVAPESELEAV